MFLHVRDARKRVPPLIAPYMAGVVSTAVNPSAVEVLQPANSMRCLGFTRHDKAADEMTGSLSGEISYYLRQVMRKCFWQT